MDTEGLYSAEGIVYESFGEYEISGIRMYTLDEAEQVIQDKIMYKDPPEVFGKGFTIIGETYYQLTYQEGIILAFTSELKENGQTILTLEEKYAIPRDDD
mmetsp:Transcript_8034/g.9164  ORF Transcript_8034/g.9164 Transcript_8034/m.9164 type:complete len:100 (+) Transcript_8034:131-430(+)